MAFGKKSIKVPAPRAKASALGNFAGGRKKTSAKNYTKSALLFPSTGFGNTGLLETPSIQGMAKKAGMSL